MAVDSNANPGGIAPAPQFPEQAPYFYERKGGVNGTRRGPLRFEEGVATDTDVPNDFQLGVMQGYQTAPGRPNHNANVFEKWPEETLKERAHVGSASWVEAPTYLNEFAQGSFTDFSQYSFERVDRSGGRYERQSPAVVTD